MGRRPPLTPKCGMNGSSVSSRPRGFTSHPEVTSSCNPNGRIMFAGWGMTHLLTSPGFRLIHWTCHTADHPTPAASGRPTAYPEDPPEGGWESLWKTAKCWSCLDLGSTWGHAKSPGPERMRSGLRFLAWVTSGKPFDFSKPRLPQPLNVEGIQVCRRMLAGPPTDPRGFSQVLPEAIRWEHWLRGSLSGSQAPTGLSIASTILAGLIYHRKSAGPLPSSPFPS